jgi:outer membrane protein TolC
MKLTITNMVFGLCLSMPVLAEIDHLHETSLAISADLTLHEVVERTYQRNPQLELMQARLTHVDALSRRAQSLWASDPAFSMSHYNDKLMDNDGAQEWVVGLDMPIWLPGQKAARQKSAEQQRLVINSSEPALKLHIAGIVRELLWSIALTKNRVSIAEQEWEVVRKLEQDVNKRVELGDLAQSDQILAQQESLSKEAAWRIARQEYRHAQHRYDMITGLNELPEIFEEMSNDDLSITIDHPTLRESYEKVTHSTALRDQVMIEKRENPSLFLGTRHERDTSDEGFDNAISFSLNIPLGLNSHTRPKITAAQVELTENRSQMEILHRQLNVAIQDASRELSATRDQYDFAQRQNELTKKHLTMSHKAFSLGETGLIEFIRIQAQAFAAERNMHQKHLQVGLHIARLNQTKGIIP